MVFKKAQHGRGRASFSVLGDRICHEDSDFSAPGEQLSDDVLKVADGGCDSTGFVSIVASANKSLAKCLKGYQVHALLVFIALLVVVIGAFGYFNASLNRRLVAKSAVAVMLLGWIVGSSLMVHYLCMKYVFKKKKRDPVDIDM